MNIKAFKVKPGDPIPPAWEKLRAYVEALPEITAGSGVRITRSSRQTIVVADPDTTAFTPRFRVTVAGTKAKVGLGTLGNRAPLVAGVGLDGKTPDGKVIAVPPLSLDEGPNEELRSWVCLDVRVDLKTGQIDPEIKDNLNITHRKDIASRFRNGFCMDDGQGNGFLPLAMLVWRDKATVGRVIQNVYFNQAHHFKSKGANAKGWHFFHPSA